MLGEKKVMATVAVKDLAAAARFYGETLGLRRAGGDSTEAITYAAAGSSLVVYRSSFAGTNQATAVTWDAGDDINAIIRELEKRGVKFEHYDMPGMKREGHVHVAGEMKAAWFKDPDGNIHALTGR